MDAETYLKGQNYWNNLSPDDRTKFLVENLFWIGLKPYLWEFIPEDIKMKIVLKIEANGLK